MSLTTLTAAALFLVIAAGAVAKWLGGPAAVMPALACGGLAAVTQLAAARLARRAFDARFTEFVGAWASGSASPVWCCWRWPPSQRRHTFRRCPARSASWAS